MVRGVRVVLVFLVVIFCIFQTVFVLYETAHFEAKMQAMAVQGTVAFCINFPPNVTSACTGDINQSTAIENNTLRCQMTATTASNTPANFSTGGTYNGTHVQYYPVSFEMVGLTFELNQSGFLTINGNQSGIGSYYVPIKIRDTSICPMETIYDYNFVIYDINDPPTLIRLFPSKAMPGKSTIVPFSINNYFIDVDNDNMTFTYWVNSSLIIKIDNVTSQVTIIAPEDVCDMQLLYFIATDEHGLSTDSNMITVDITCDPKDAEKKEGGGGGANCEPEWKCKDWGRCFINNTQVRSCTDIHLCNPNDYKRDFWKECVYIPTCYDNVKNAGETGVDCGGPCPACSEKIPEKNETCDDGIKNQGELGIDCGGPCPVCKQVEVPGLLPEEYSNNLLTVAMIIILVAGALVVTYFIFRKEIKTLMAKLGWWFTRKRRKQILLKDDEREDLLTRIKALEVKVKKIEVPINSSNRLFQEFLDISRAYFDYALKIKSYSDEDVELALKLIKNINLIRAMKIFIQRQVEFEMSEVSLDRELVMYYVQDLRQLVLNTSNYDKKDYSFIARALPIDEDDSPLEKGKNLLYNATVALEFTDVESAKVSYFELLKIYELLDDSGKELLFYELTKLFNYVKYTISWKALETRI